MSIQSSMSQSLSLPPPALSPTTEAYEPQSPPPIPSLIDILHPPPAPSLLQRILLCILSLFYSLLTYLTPITSTTPRYSRHHHSHPQQPYDTKPLYAHSNHPHSTFVEKPKSSSSLNSYQQRQHPHLWGAYAPVPAPQVFPPPRIIGELPLEVGGLFARIGPNPYYAPRGGYHVFDGDGCVASIRIRTSKGKGDVGVWWGRVETEKLTRERVSEGKVRRENLGGIVGVVGLIKGILRILLKVLGLRGDDSVANTNLCWWGGRLMALYEGGLPWALKVLEWGSKGVRGEMKTVGRVGFAGILDKKRFSAHPRPGPGGLLYAVNYKWGGSVPAEVIAVDAVGKVVKKVDIPLDRWPVIHDTCVTKRFVLVMDLPLVFSLKAMLKGGLPVDFKENGTARFGLMPVSAASHEDIMWFDVQSGFIFHTVAAWEEKDSNKVIFWACRMRRVELSMGPEVKNHPKLWRWELNLNTGQAMGSLEYSEYDIDFPAVDENLLGGPVRYCYLSILEREDLPTGPSPIEDITGIVKFDMFERKKVAELRFSGREKHVVTGGECQFIPRNNAEGEDDGYLMTLVHNWTLNRSELRIYDAKCLDTDPISSIVMEGQRIPSGFHTIFIPEKDLDSQRPWV